MRKPITLKMQLLQLDHGRLSYQPLNILNVYLNSTGALNLQEIPEKIVVIGGGVIGIELRRGLCCFGTQVTVLEGAEDILGVGFENKCLRLLKKN